MDPRSVAEHAGHLRDWDEVATAVYAALMQRRDQALVSRAD